MQLIENKITVKDYLDIHIIDDIFDDVERSIAEIVIIFQVQLSNSGLMIDIHEIKSIKWSYTGVMFGEETNKETELSGSSDDSWKIVNSKSKSRNENYGLYLDNIIIDIKNKEINIDFEG